MQNSTPIRRWFETRCVEGEFVGGRLVGDFIVDRDLVDELDPTGTIVTDNGEVLELPDPDERSQLQPCNGPTIVDRPIVTPFEATGLRIGDETGPVARPAGFNEIGEYDITLAPSWIPVGSTDAPGVIGFILSDALEFPPSPDDTDFYDQFTVIYADDGVTRLGEFGPDGSPTLDT